MYACTMDRKMAVLKAIQNNIYTNYPIAVEYGVSAHEIAQDKQYLYSKDFIDRGFNGQTWILTDLGEQAIEYGFRHNVPTEETKLDILRVIHETDIALSKYARLNHKSAGWTNCHKRWLVENGFVSNETRRGKLTEKGLLALKDKSILKHMEVSK